MAACIVCKGQVISCETNSLKTHPLQAEYASKPERIHLHAEIACLIRARWPRNSLEGGHMYVGRVMKDGSWGASKPCSGCFAAIQHAGLSKVTFYDPYQGFGNWRTTNVPN